MSSGSAPAGARVVIVVNDDPLVRAQVASVLPTEWTRVLERNPDAMNPGPLPGYVRLDTPWKVLHVEAARLELRDHPPA